MKIIVILFYKIWIVNVNVIDVIEMYIMTAIYLIVMLVIKEYVMHVDVLFVYAIIVFIINVNVWAMKNKKIIKLFNNKL